MGMEMQVAVSAKELQEMIDGHWSALQFLSILKLIQLGKETKNIFCNVFLARKPI